MNTLYSRICAAALLAFATLSANAATVAVSGPSSVPINTSFQVTVDVTGLVSSGTPSIGAYDLQLAYDSSILNLVGIAFGTGLGSSLKLPSTSTPGLVGATEVSFETPTALDALQAGAFTLFTLTFSAIQGGTSPLTLTALGPFADANGLELTGLTLQSGQVSAVPLPAAAWLLLSALGGLGLVRRHRAS